MSDLCDAARLSGPGSGGPVAPTRTARGRLRPLPFGATALDPAGLLGHGGGALPGAGHEPGRAVGRRLLRPHSFGAQYVQDHAPVREPVEPVGDAVRQLYSPRA